MSHAVSCHCRATGLSLLLRAGWAAIALSAESPPQGEQVWTVGEVKSRLQNQRGELRSLFVRYRLEAEPLVDRSLLQRWHLFDAYAYDLCFALFSREQ
jgi:hypothetical protein